MEDLSDLGTLNLILSGGEPLAHPDFFAIGSRARDLGFVVRVKSNGHALRGELARRLREEVDPFLVETSLHGARPETHDRQTRVRGSFERLMENIPQWLDLGLRVKVNSTLTAWNEDELEAMMALTRSLGVPLQVDPEVTPRDDGDTEPLSIRPSRAAIERLVRLQEEARREALEADVASSLTVQREGDSLLPPGEAEAAMGGKHCGAGSSTVAIDPYGTVYPCVQWRRPVGNLHRRSMAEIWNGSQELEAVRDASRTVRTAVENTAPDGVLADFCPGAAEAATGDPSGLHEGARERMEIRRHLRRREQEPLLPVLQ